MGWSDDPSPQRLPHLIPEDRSQHSALVPPCSHTPWPTSGPHTTLKLTSLEPRIPAAGGREGCQGAEDPGSGKNFPTPSSVSQGLAAIHAPFQPAGFCCVPGRLYVCGQRTRERTHEAQLLHSESLAFVSCQEESQCSSVGDDTSLSTRPQAAQTEPWTKMRNHG